jgi:CBS domain containing-hemolysin-like protein
VSVIWTLLISVLLLVLNGFFVAAEFALVAAKRHRLEQAAATGSRAARAALAGSRELSTGHGSASSSSRRYRGLPARGPR